MGDENLTVRISTETGASAQQIEDLAKKLEALESAYKRSETSAHGGTEAVKAHGQAHHESAGKVEEHTGVLGRFVEAANDMGSASRTMAIGFEQVGLEASAAAVRVSGLAEVIERAGQAAPELLAIGAVLATVSIAAVELKESLDAAAASQAAMVSVSALIKNQGAEDWKEQAESVEQYAAALAMTTTFTKTEVLSGIREMLAYGLSLNDAIRSQTAAMDLARAKAVPLAEAESILAMAHDGHTMALVRLGIVTRDEAKDGIAYETVLQRIQSRFDGLGTAVDGYTAKMQSFHNIVEDVRDKIGTALLPVMEQMADQLRAGATALEPLAAQFQLWAVQHAPELKQAMHEIGDAVGNVVVPAVRLLIQGTERAVQAFTDLSAWVGAHKQEFSDFFGGLGSIVGAAADAIGMRLSASFNTAKGAAQPLLDVLAGFGRTLTELRPIMTDVFVVLLASQAVNAFNGVRIAATTAIAAMTASTWWTVLSLGVEAVAAAFVNGLTPAIWANIVAWGQLAVAEAAATLGFSAVVAALVGGTVYLWNHWDETLSSAGGLWNTLATTVEHSAARINSALAGVYDTLAERARELPLIGSKISEFFTQQADDLKRTANEQGAFGLGPARHKIQDALTGEWLWSDTMEPVEKRKEKGPPAPPAPPRPPTTPSSTWIPGTGTGAEKRGYIPPEIAPFEETADFSPVIKHADELTQFLDGLKAREADLAHAMKMTTDQAQYHAAAMDLTKAKVEDAKAAVDAITFALDDEQAMLKRSEDATHEKFRAMVDAQQAQVAYNKSLEGGTPSADEVKHQRELAAAVKAAEKEHSKAEATLKKLRTAIEGHNQQLRQAVIHYAEIKGAVEEAVPTLEREWAKFFGNEKAKYQEDVALANASNAQKVAYYKDALQKIDSFAADGTFAPALSGMTDDEQKEHVERAKQLWQQYLAAVKGVFADERAEQKKTVDDADALNLHRIKAFSSTTAEELQADRAYYAQLLAGDERYAGDHLAIREKMAALDTQLAEAAIDEQKKALDRITGYETTFLDGVLKNHQSLADSLKGVFKKIYDDWATTIENMIVKSTLMSALNSPNGTFGKFFQAMGLGAAVGSTGNPQLDAAVTQRIASEHSIVTSAQMLNTQGITPATVAFQSVAQAATQAAAALRAMQPGAGASGGGGGSLLDLFGLGSGSDSLSPDQWANSPSLTPEVLGLGVDAPSIDIASVGGKSLNGANGVLPTSIEKMAGGAMQGFMIGGMIASLDGGNSTWGSILGGVGGALGGPVGSAIGGLIGSLLGNHSLGPSKQPDIYNPAWGQADVDWNGAAGAQDFNGTKYTAASQYNVGMGGTPLYKLFENWVNANKDNASSLTPDQQALLAKGLALEGGNPNADFGVVREANNIAYLANGQQISVPDLIAMEQAYTSNVGTGPLSSALFQVTRTYPDLSIGNLSANGTYTPTPVNVTNPNGGTTGGVGGGGVGPINVTLNVDGQQFARAMVPFLAGGLRDRSANLIVGSPGASSLTV